MGKSTRKRLGLIFAAVMCFVLAFSMLGMYTVSTTASAQASIRRVSQITEMAQMARLTPREDGMRTEGLTEGLTSRGMARAASDLIGDQVVEQGSVLLLNRVNDEGVPTLPLAAGSRMQVFGRTSVELVYGLAGSSGASTAKSYSDVLQVAMAEEGFDVNDELTEFYLNGVIRPDTDHHMLRSGFLFADAEETVAIGPEIESPTNRGTAAAIAANPELFAEVRHRESNTLIPTPANNRSGFGRSVPHGVNAHGLDTAGATGQTPWVRYQNDSAVWESINEHGGNAVVVFSRIGGEGWDLGRRVNGRGIADIRDWSSAAAWAAANRDGTGGNAVDGGRPSFIAGRSGNREIMLPDGTRVSVPRNTDSYLVLDEHESDLLRGLNELKQDGVIDTITVLINSMNAMELGFLTDYETYGVDAAILIGHIGGGPRNLTRHMAVAGLLSGRVNPSGRTANIMNRYHHLDPTWFNFASNNGLNPFSPNPGTDFANRGGSYSGGGIGGGDSHFVEYREGIYMGYRYWETRGFEEMQAGNADWYDEHVVFPFGFGLSYTEFTWEIQEVTEVLNKYGNIEVTVKVTNEGLVPGRDVVQLYYSAPLHLAWDDEYSRPVGIEKSHIVLGAFNDTGIIEPGDYEIITISMPVKQMSSWCLENGNRVLEEGEYTLWLAKGNVGSNVWRCESTIENNLSFTIDLLEEVRYEYSSTGEAYRNLFQDETNYMKGLARGGAQADQAVFTNRAQNASKVMSRANFDFTFPRFLLTADRELTTAGATWMIRARQTHSAAFDTLEAQTSTEQLPDWYRERGWVVEAGTSMPTVGADNGLMLGDMHGLDFYDPQWSDFMDQLNDAQMAGLIRSGFFRIGTNLPQFGITRNVTIDGPFGLTQGGGNGTMVMGTDTGWFPSSVMVAQTFNEVLADRVGVAMGDEALLWGVPALYSPGVNTHRSPFGGRNSEYHSEDPILAGRIGAATVRGLQRRGVIPFLKHYFLNDQETNRDAGNGLNTWADEQTIREVHADHWRIAVEEGGLMGMMSSFARVGRTWAGAHYAVQMSLLRYEWGFQGVMVTDWAGMGRAALRGSYMDMHRMIRTGGDLFLGENDAGDTPATWGTEIGASATARTAARRAVQSILFGMANSSASVGYGTALNNTLVVGQEGVHLDIQPRSIITHNAFTGGMNMRTTVNNRVYDLNYTTTAANNLPAGLTYSNGIISGSPTETGTFTFTVTATQPETPGSVAGSGSARAVGTRLATNTFTIEVLAEEPPGPDLGPELDAVVNFTTVQWFPMTWELHGGEWAPGFEPVESVIEGGTLPLPTEPTRDGYDFVGWFTQATGGARVTFPVQQVGIARTFHARWREEGTAHTITWNLEGGEWASGFTPVSSIETGQSLAAPTAPTKAGYDFVGWYTAATGGTRITLPATVTADMVLYARWTPDGVQHQINWQLNGGTWVTPPPATVEAGGTIALPTAPTRAGYTFTGWFTAATGGEAVVLPMENVTANQTIHAQWTPVTTTPGGCAGWGNAGTGGFMGLLLGLGLGGGALFLILSSKKNKRAKSK